MSLHDSYTVFQTSAYSFKDRWDAWRIHRRHRAAYRELLELNDRLLRDIGVDRYSVLALLEKNKTQGHPASLLQPLDQG